MDVKFVITLVEQSGNIGGYTAHWKAVNGTTGADLGYTGTYSGMFPHYVTIEQRRDSILRELTGYFAALLRDWQRANEDFPILKPFLEGMEFEV